MSGRFIEVIRAEVTEIKRGKNGKASKNNLCHLVVTKGLRGRRRGHSVPRVQYCSDQTYDQALLVLRCCPLITDSGLRTEKLITRGILNIMNYYDITRRRRAHSSFLFAINQE